MTRRRWIADSWDQSTASLTGEQASHLIRVLRAQAGMEYDIVAGDRVWHGVIAGISGDAVRFNLMAEVEADPALPITLLLSIFKFDRLEWAIEKATELGVERIVPVIARRSEKHLAQSAANRVERWRRIAREAAKQSRRSDIPTIEDVLPLKTAARQNSDAKRLLLAEQERSTTLRHAVEEAIRDAGENMPAIRLAIGPEGGWTAEEEALFGVEGWRSVSLGPRILRAETAAITAAAVVAALME
ncbi:16S rRNA (uracil(1498)-N(3))-methyltransferase [Acidobacterium sp. S8]|uniref:16S rRNA (uracil(1498)-N(3))-methyltransferase n=1 Tax=Acidobacterium sp. S8 TaxID=1641854 RepID=UPI00131BDF24|nr:16S rRNA (uracil(1498)-N(3))-methyltransferase [Acidobacterium sp. S8]